MKKILVLCCAILAITSIGCSKSNEVSVEVSDKEVTQTAEKSGAIEFVALDGDGVTKPFQMSATEITNQQYVDF